jgi:hypothetical protein
VGTIERYLPGKPLGTDIGDCGRAVPRGGHHPEQANNERHGRELQQRHRTAIWHCLHPVVSLDFLVSSDEG